jgi:hypothetical protein
MKYEKNLSTSEASSPPQASSRFATFSQEKENGMNLIWRGVRG